MHSATTMKVFLLLLVLFAATAALAQVRTGVVPHHPLRGGGGDHAHHGSHATDVPDHAVAFSNGGGGLANLTGDATQFTFVNSETAVTITKPSSQGSLSTLLTLNSDPAGAHGFGAHLAIAGNPGGGGTIWREDGGLYDSWLQLYGGGYDGNSGGQIYVNGINSGDGDAGGVQVVVATSSSDPATASSFQVLGPGGDGYPTYLSVIAAGDSGQVQVPSLLPNSAVATDSNSVLVSSATTAFELDHLHGVTANVQLQLNALRGVGSNINGFDRAPTDLDQAIRSIVAALVEMRNGKPIALVD